MMKAIMVRDDGRVVYATQSRFAAKNLHKQDDIFADEEFAGEDFIPQVLLPGYVLVDEIPEGNLADYRYENEEFIYAPMPVEEVKPSLMDMLEAQVTYTAMVTDTLLEV